MGLLDSLLVALPNGFEFFLGILNDDLLDLPNLRNLCTDFARASATASQICWGHR